MTQDDEMYDDELCNFDIERALSPFLGNMTLRILLDGAEYPESTGGLMTRTQVTKIATNEVRAKVEAQLALIAASSSNTKEDYRALHSTVVRQELLVKQKWHTSWCSTCR
jgi:hypothetical protein